MNTLEIIEELDTRFGNQYAPDHYRCIQAGTAELRRLLAENEELKTTRGNSVLVPSDKLKEMQNRLKELEKANG